MDLITTAIMAGVANLSKDVIKDSYNALKAAFKKKFGEKSDIVNAVDGLEKKPDSDGRKTTLLEEVEMSKVNDDPEILRLAEDLLSHIKEQPGGQQVINQTISNVKYAATSGTGTASINNIAEHGALEASKDS